MRVQSEIDLDRKRKLRFLEDEITAMEGEIKARQQVVFMAQMLGWQTTEHTALECVTAADNEVEQRVRTMAD